MSGYQLSNGSTIQQSKTLSAAVVITAITNAAQPVLTLEEELSGLVAGDFVIINSAWIDLDNGVYQVSDVSTTSVTLTADAEGIVDTTDLTRFPAGAGVGELRRVIDWVSVPYTTDVNTTGGEQQTVDFQPIQLDRAITLNTFKNGYTQAFTITHSAIDEIRPMLIKQDRSQETVAVRFNNPRAKETRVYGAQVSFARIPTVATNAIETCVITYSLQSNMVIYSTT